MVFGKKMQNELKNTFGSSLDFHNNPWIRWPGALIRHSAPDPGRDTGTVHAIRIDIARMETYLRIWNRINGNLVLFMSVCIRAVAVALSVRGSYSQKP